MGEFMKLLKLVRGLFRRGKCSCILVAAICVAGCAPSVGTLINESVRSSDRRATVRANELLEQHLSLIDRLRAQGDPLGDYLWVRANADGWVKDPVRDPLVLKKMFEDAAAKGSADAKHVLGLMLFDGAASRTGVNTSGAVLDPKDQNWRAGLALIDEATKQQCWYWAPILDGMANKTCLRPVSTAGIIEPNFREGSRVVQRDDIQQKHWKQLNENCKAFISSQGPKFFFPTRFTACR